MAASMKFQRWKEVAQSATDFSKKGSIDDYIVTLVEYINSHADYFTTSSCSGRVNVYAESAESGVKKKNCTWLYTTHDFAEAERVLNAIKENKSDAVLKFEPFVLHVQCRTLEDARVMHQVSIESGFRNSGISVGKSGKIITAVRSTHGLEVPLAADGNVLVSDCYVEFLVKLANKKLEENRNRIDRFFSNMKMHIIQPTKKNVDLTPELSKREKQPLHCTNCGSPLEEKYSMQRKQTKHFRIQNHSLVTDKTDNTLGQTQLHSDDEDGDLEDICTLFNT